MTKSAKNQSPLFTSALNILLRPIPIHIINTLFEKYADHYTKQDPQLYTKLAPLSGHSILFVATDLPHTISITFNKNHFSIEAKQDELGNYTTTICGTSHAIEAYCNNVVVSSEENAAIQPGKPIIEGDEHILTTFLKTINLTSYEIRDYICDSLGTAGPLLDHYIAKKKWVFNKTQEGINLLQETATAPSSNISATASEAFSRIAETMQNLKK